ncbi:hypothetical protein GCM10009122_35350 [Fulvivirga kasyanovii]|uniref:PKD domain-containing protein n=1 Tax=Fulvivirga kasyanovii TaxID=396812 RepID=A0ABW9RV63_9BACT|nr:hypothetical protein [Fulvivirga kasyanovii]MTI27596.1 hypothetical protein [Fulvivirga kasyanovii]
MKKIFVNALILSGILLMASCSDDDSKVVPADVPFVNPEVAEVYVGTQSPGDVWTWSLDKEQGHMTASWDYGTFDDTSDDIAIEGTFETFPSGFMKVTITNAEPANDEIPTDGTAWFYALEIPGMAMIIKPEGSIKGDIIAMVPEGDCANIPGSYNYIITAPGGQSDFDPITDEAFGYVDFAASGNGFDISGYKFSLDCVNDGACTDSGTIEGLPVATCVNNGFVEIMDGGKTVAQGQFTNAGAMMMDFGYGNGGVFALKTDANATKDALLNNTYNGIAYLPKHNDEQTVPVKLSFAKNDLNNMIGTGYKYTNIENGTVDNEEGAVVIVEDVINGRVLGSMNFDEDNDVSDMAAALLVNGNDQILIVTSYDEESLNPIILILAKQN